MLKNMKTLKINTLTANMARGERLGLVLSDGEKWRIFYVTAITDTTINNVVDCCNLHLSTQDVNDMKTETVTVLKDSVMCFVEGLRPELNFWLAEVKKRNEDYKTYKK